MSGVRYECCPGAAAAIEAWRATRPAKRPNPLTAKTARPAEPKPKYVLREDALERIADVLGRAK